MRIIITEHPAQPNGYDDDNIPNISQHRNAMFEFGHVVDWYKHVDKGCTCIRHAFVDKVCGK